MGCNRCSGAQQLVPEDFDLPALPQERGVESDRLRNKLFGSVAKFFTNSHSGKMLKNGSAEKRKCGGVA